MTRTFRDGTLGRLQLMNRSPLKFFLLVFALSIPFWLIQPRDWPISASVGVPLMAALILVYREEGRGRGVRRILSRVFDQWRIRKRIWYVPMIFLMPLLYLLRVQARYLPKCLGEEEFSEGRIRAAGTYTACSSLR
jgi:hypothetical protein